MAKRGQRKRGFADRTFAPSPGRRPQDGEPTSIRPQPKGTSSPSSLDLAARLAVFGMLLIGLGGIGAAVAGAARGGIGWDSAYETYLSILARSIDPRSTLDQAYVAIPGTFEFYGVLTQSFADGIHGLFTGSTALLEPQASDTYFWQGLANTVVAVFGAGVLAAAVAAILASPVAGAFTWAGLATLPVWAGMSHVDFKDLPVAVGLSVLGSGIGLSWRFARRDRMVIVGAGLAIAGAGVALGARIGSFALLAAVAGISGLVVLERMRVRDVRTVGAVWGTIATGVAGGLVLAGFVNPVARINPVRLLVDAAAVMRHYPASGTTRMLGLDVDQNQVPLWYVPAWVAAQLPLLLLAVVMVGLAAVVLSVRDELRTVGHEDAGAARRTSGGPATHPGPILSLSPLLAQGLLLPLIIVGTGSVLYDGVRQLLFVYPATVVIAAIGIWYLDRRAIGFPSRRRIMFAAVPVVVVAASLFGLLRWFPYEYAFVNPLAGSMGQDAWELDYWGVTAREGAARAGDLGPDMVSVAPTSGTASPFAPVTPWEEIPAGSTYALYHFMRAGGRIDPSRCSVEFRIERDGLSLGEGGTCVK